MSADWRNDQRMADQAEQVSTTGLVDTKQQPGLTRSVDSYPEALKPAPAPITADRFASITAFVRVAESGGFSAAGRRLDLSKATVSDQVQALENALGVRLLNRTTRRVSLTEIGRGYYSCQGAHNILGLANQAGSASCRRLSSEHVTSPLPLLSWGRPDRTVETARTPPHHLQAALARPALRGYLSCRKLEMVVFGD